MATIDFDEINPLLEQLSKTGKLQDERWIYVRQYLIPYIKHNITLFLEAQSTDDDQKPDTAVLQYITETLESSDFETSPPFTIQRLAEIVHQPFAHYTRLEKYLRAVERVVSVTSTVQDYPTTKDEPAVDILALFSPIPWLKSDGGNSTDAPASQGELLLHKQNSADVGDDEPPIIISANMELPDRLETGDVQ